MSQSFGPLFQSDPPTAGFTPTSYANVTASRSTGVVYTNTSGKTMFVIVTPTASATLEGTFNVAGAAVAYIQVTPGSGGGGSPFFVIVPIGATYEVIAVSNYNVSTWYELT